MYIEIKAIIHLVPTSKLLLASIGMVAFGFLFIMVFRGGPSRQNGRSLLILGVVLLIVAPIQLLSPGFGPDYVHFQDFTNSMLTSWWNFYADSRYIGEPCSLPPGNCYIYPPVSAVALAIFRTVFSAVDWLLFMRTFLVVVNLLLGLVLHTSGRGTQGALLAGLTLLHPFFTTYTVSEGQIDSLMLLLVATGIFLLSRGNTTLGFVMLTMGVLTKQYAAFAALPVFVSILLRTKRKEIIKIIALSLVVIALVNVPFMLTSSAAARFISVWFPSSYAAFGPAEYNVNSFSGIWSLLGVLHEAFGLESLPVYHASPWAQIALLGLAALAAASHVRHLGAQPVLIWKSAFAGIIAFFVGNREQASWRLPVVTPFTVYLLLELQGWRRLIPVTALAGLILYRIADLAVMVYPFVPIYWAYAPGDALTFIGLSACYVLCVAKPKLAR